MVQDHIKTPLEECARYYSQLLTHAVSQGASPDFVEALRKASEQAFWAKVLDRYAVSRSLFVQNVVAELQEEGKLTFVEASIEHIFDVA